MSKLFKKNHQQTTLEETQEEEINTSYYNYLPIPHPLTLDGKTD